MVSSVGDEASWMEAEENGKRRGEVCDGREVDVELDFEGRRRGGGLGDGFEGEGEGSGRGHVYRWDVCWWPEEEEEGKGNAKDEGEQRRGDELFGRRRPMG